MEVESEVSAVSDRLTLLAALVVNAALLALAAVPLLLPGPGTGKLAPRSG